MITKPKIRKRPKTKTKANPDAKGISLESMAVMNHEDECSKEMVYIAMTLLESKGYAGFSGLMSVLDDPELIIKLLRLFYGSTIEFPPLQTVVKCLKTAIYVYYNFHKRSGAKAIVTSEIRKLMNIDEKEEQELIIEMKEWINFMLDEGIDLSRLMHINKKTLIKRYDTTKIAKNKHKM